MNTFLAEGYKIPTESNYLNPSKLPQGETNFRILSSAIVGYEYWTNDNKPIRAREIWKKRPDDIKIKDDGTFDVKHFWAFVVWHYEDSKVKIMEVTQKTIMNGIKSLVDNAKWGDPKEYDITLTKTGELLKTEYSTVPNPKTELQAEIIEEYKNKPVNLEALYLGNDPFQVDGMTDEEKAEAMAIEV